MSADVDILIVNYATPALTKDAAKRLRDAGRVLVWDNSGDLAAADLPDAELYGVGRNILYAAASNALYQRSNAPIVVLLNADAFAAPDDVRALRQALVEDRNAWGAAPRLIDSSGHDQHYRRRLPTSWAMFVDRMPLARLVFGPAYRRFYYLDADPAVSGFVEQPAAACLALRRSLVGATLFDERYPLFGNDLDLAKRMFDLGYRALYVAGVEVRHVGGASIEVVRRLDASWVRREYDRALRTYARHYLRLSPLLEPVFALRMLAHRLLQMFGRWRVILTKR